MKRTAVSLCALVVSIGLPMVARAQSNPTPAEARAAIEQVLVSKQQSAPKFEVRAVEACYPIVGRPRAERLCLLDMNDLDGDFRLQQVGFVSEAGKWSLLDPTKRFEPACPSMKEAEALFQKELGDSTLRVTEGDEEGTTTDTRGKFRNETGPERLMCAYTITRRLGEATVVAYFRFESDKYVLEPKPEVWWD